MRLYLGIDESDSSYVVLAYNEGGEEVYRRDVKQSTDSLSEFGGWLNAQVANGFELYASLERPHGRIVDFLLDHGAMVFPVNPKSLARARERYRVSGGHDDWFDAFVLGNSLRVDHVHLHSLHPNTEVAAELKVLTRDAQKIVSRHTRCVNQIIQTLKEYYRRPLDVFSDLRSKMVLDFLRQFPTPEALSSITKKQWLNFAKSHRKDKEWAEDKWQLIVRDQLPVKDHIVRTKSRLLLHLLDELSVLADTVKDYEKEIERFFVDSKMADLARSLPACKTGRILPTLWAELGDAPGHWQSFRHLQGAAGTTPYTNKSGKDKTVHYRFGCNKVMRYAIHWFTIHSIRKSVWAKAYFEKQLKHGKTYNEAVRALASKWLKIIFIMWRDNVPYDENRHLANIARENIKQGIYA